MNAETKTVSIKYPGFLTLLGLLFIGLKLTDKIDWSWWWVLAPFWGPFAFVAGLMLLVGFFAVIVAIFEK